MRDRYWESAVGSRRKSHWSDKPNPLSAPWLTETSWRGSALSPAGIHAMRYYILPFRYHDLLGVTREECAARQMLDTEFWWRRCRGTPAEFAGNWLWQCRREQEVLRGKVPGDEAAAIKVLAEYHARIQRGLHWREPRRTLEVPRLKKAPVIDGVLSADEVAAAFRFSGEYPLDSMQKVAENGSFWLVGWYDDRFYAAGYFCDSEIISFNGTARNSGRKMHEADSLELFMRPDCRRPHYYEWIVNPARQMWSLEHWSRERGGFCILDVERETASETAAQPVPGGYSIELSIPLRELHGIWCRRMPQPGDRFDFILVRTDLSGGTFCRSTPVPFLYDGHNIFGYIQAGLGK